MATAMAGVKMRMPLVTFDNRYVQARLGPTGQRAAHDDFADQAGWGVRWITGVICVLWLGSLKAAAVFDHVADGCAYSHYYVPGAGGAITGYRQNPFNERLLEPAGLIDRDDCGHVLHHDTDVERKLARRDFPVRLWPWLPEAHTSSIDVTFTGTFRCRSSAPCS